MLIFAMVRLFDLIRRSLAIMILLLVCGGISIAQPANGEPHILELPYDELVGDLERSHTILSKTISQVREQGSADTLAALHAKLATVTYLKGQLDSATYHGLAAAEIFKRTGNEVELGAMLCGLGHMVKRRDLAQAFKFYHEGLALLKDHEEAVAERATAFDNYGVLHEMKGDQDSALFYYRSSLALKERSNDTVGIPYSLNKIATNHILRGEFVTAEEILWKADSIRQAIGDRMGLADQELYYGDLYQAWGKYDKAIDHFQEGLRMSGELNAAYLQQYAHERSAECQEALGLHREALLSTRAAMSIKDSLLNERNSRTILELEQRYRVAEKDKEIADLERSEAQRRFQLSIAIGALLFISIAGIWLHQWRQRRIKAQRDAAIIEEREKGLQGMIHATEKERARLARELHDGIGQQLGGLRHRMEMLGDPITLNGRSEEFASVIGIMDETSREVRELAHQLMPKALVRLGLVPALEELFQRNSTDRTECHFDHHDVPADLSPEIAAGLFRICQELLGNIRKHAQARSVDAQLLRNGNSLVLMVHDDGVGISAGQKGGIGLINISDRARALGGKFDLESRPGEGTTATVRIPLQVPIKK